MEGFGHVSPHYALKSRANSLEMKLAALSKPITSGKPSVANVVLNKLIVVAAELDAVL